MFSENTIKFLFENYANNSREYFNSHREEYERYVLTPFKEFVTAMSEAVLEIDDKLITEPKVNKTISRINRDTRFSKDKSLYRDHIWVSFRRDKKAMPHYPEIFFSVSPDEFTFGCGYWFMYPESNKTYRKLILENENSAQRALSSFEKINGCVLVGDKYKKNPYTDRPETEQDWLLTKNPAVLVNSTDAELLFSDKIIDECKRHFKEFEPIYNFFTKTEEITRK